MTPATMTAGVLVLAVVLGWGRIAWWWRTAAAQPPWWRPALLLAAQPLLAALLYLTLFPPPADEAREPSLAVATRGAALASADVALPEAARTSAADHAPDLATALRRHPGTRRIRILGEGLEPRDREAARDVAVDFLAPAPRRGLIALVPPPRTAPGAPFRVGGQAAGVAGARVDLLDPAGGLVDTTTVAADGTFVLTGAARVPGVALFRVRLRGGDDVAVPVASAAEAAVRVLHLAGAPGPEVKYWRRWAADAGLTATVSMPAGAGIELGDRAPVLTPAALARYDLVVVDDRRWASLGGGERAALAGAVRGGLGLLLRVTSPLPAGVRAGWAAIGAPVAMGRGERPVRLGGADVPVLARWDTLAPAAVTLARDAAGTPIAAWRARGRGRVGLWTLGDAFALVPAGHAVRFGALWSDAVSTLARPLDTVAPRVSDWPVAGERADVCGIAPATIVVAPDGTRTAPMVDGSGCAGFWPRRSGWHVIEARNVRRPFYVAEAGAIAGLRAADRREATLRLVGAGTTGAIGAGPPTVPGRSWPWLLAFLTLAGALWWFERRPRAIGRP